jgi:hypothetical protein
MSDSDRIRIEAVCEELLEIANRQAHRTGLGSDLDEALLASMEFFCAKPSASAPPSGVFRMCLRRAIANRLKINEEKQSSGE